jgi:NAD(P)-dependent dehydrogenase (short-subunit alcohol dehydrogenase family)
MPFYKEQDVPDQTGRTILITGANAGIGFEAARVLAGKGAQVLLGCRDETKALDAIDRIKAVHIDADLAWVPLDLASLISVRAAAEQVNALPQLDVLINNAGVMVPPKTLTEDGFELQFGVNHLGHFALTGLLLDTLRAQPDSRIVNVSSLAHHMGKIDFDDINAERSYDAMTRYAMRPPIPSLLAAIRVSRIRRWRAICPTGSIRPCLLCSRFLTPPLRALCQHSWRPPATDFTAASTSVQTCAARLHATPAKPPLPCRPETKPPPRGCGTCQNQ